MKMTESEVNSVFHESIDLIREQFGSMFSLFDELKHAASFIYEIGLRIDALPSERCETLKKKIDNLFLSLNESMFEASSRIIGEINAHVESLKLSKNEITSTSEHISTIQTIPYDELYVKYNDALNQNVGSTAHITELSHKFNELQTKNSDLVNQVEELTREKRELEKRLKDIQIQIAEKENKKATPEPPNSSQCLNSSMVSVSVTADEIIEKTKTANDFIEIFEKVFKSADEVVQIIKLVEKTTPRENSTVRALEKSRFMRQMIYDMLVVFKKAKLNPTILSSDVSSQVAEELKRIYETLKLVKSNTENRVKSNTEKRSAIHQKN